MTTITLDGSSLTIEQLVAIARDPSIFVERHPSTEAIVARGEELIAQIVENYRRAYEAGDRLR
jgi:histidine ammonia-lyase